MRLIAVKKPLVVCAFAANMFEVTQDIFFKSGLRHESSLLNYTAAIEDIILASLLTLKRIL